jgi:hypothetical protein
VSVGIDWNAVTLLQQAEAVLTTELPTVLDALETAHGVTVPDVRSIIRSEVPEVVLSDTPLVQLYVESTQRDPSTAGQADAFGAWYVEHTMVARVLMAAYSGADDVDGYSDARRILCWGIAYALQLYLPTADYGAAVGVYECRPETINTELVFEDERSGQWFQAVQIRMLANQRMRMGPLPV